MLKWPRPPSEPAWPSVGLPPASARPSCGAMYWKTSLACCWASSAAVCWVGVPVGQLWAPAARRATSESPAAARSRAFMSRSLLIDNDPTGPADRTSDAPGGHPCAERAVDDGSGVGAVSDDYHADAQI